ncbi:MAG: chemotaxis protein MotB [Candidatus Rokuibacteriota bacterium]|nr:MAG: chemotaxis protein MotB [Candidatus Rokubacteria bacterium]
MQRSYLFVPLLVAGLLTGCVSSSKYHELESTTSAERAALEKDIASLRSQVASQREEVARREGQITSLNQKIASLDQQSTDLEAKKAGLERDVAALNDRLSDAEKRAAEATAQKDAEINRLKGTYDSLVKDLKSEISKGEIKVTQIRDKLSVQMVEKILFDSGKAEIKPQGKEVLSKVGQVLQGVRDKQIRIEGHTDSVPISVALRQQFPTNWELSAVRATTVLRYLEEKAGVDAKNLAAVGYGPFRPVASNDTPEGKAENRRIEISLTPLDVTEVLKELK